MSVIVSGTAGCDGPGPVHRRILYTMFENNLAPQGLPQMR